MRSPVAGIVALLLLFAALIVEKLAGIPALAIWP